MVREIALQVPQGPLAGHRPHDAIAPHARVQLVVGRLAVPVGCLAPADSRVLLLDELVEPAEARVRVGVEDRLEGSVSVFDGQHLAGEFLPPVVLVREQKIVVFAEKDMKITATMRTTYDVGG